MLLALAACEKKQPPGLPADSAAKTGQDAAAAASSSVAAPHNLSEVELRAFLQRWLDAQNQGNYEAYAALYAQKFFGVKRAGPRVTRFAREGWLEDRKRMFQKPMTVEAKEPRFRAGLSSAEIELTQRFASGTFADEGLKRLLVVREAGTLKLAQEEMLKSRETAKPSPNLNTEFDLHFVITLESGAYVVLEPATDLNSEAPVRGERARDGEAPEIIVTSRALEADQLTPELIAWKGATLRLDNGCRAQLGKFMLLSRVDPHFGTEQEWRNENGNQPRAATQQEINASAFALSDRAVVAQLTGCNDEGTFAQRASTPPPVLAEPVHEEEIEQRARAAFAKLPQVKEQQAGYLGEVEGAKGAWWESSLQIDVYRHPASRQTLVSARASIEGISCADYAAQVWAFFELRGKQLVHLRSASMRGEVKQVFDLNGDGRLELMVDPMELGTELELVSPDEGGPTGQLDYSYQDCPC
jgi:hypothetical protein